MDIKKELSRFKEKIDIEIGLRMDEAIKEAIKNDKLIGEALEYVKKFTLAGGKRLRPAFMYWGYLAAGGKEEEKIFKTSVSIELIHVFLLIHDDIIDRDKKRHGVDTVNFHYDKIGKSFFGHEKADHFGDSMAIIIGDMIGAIGSQIIFDSKFPPDLIMKALSRLQSIVSMTVIGQSKDLYMGYKRDGSEEEILEMYEYKTAKYTLEGPLHLGLILGGGRDDQALSMSNYAIPLGIAFQIQDDILGIFGSEKKLGKAVGSDIKEGKQTLLLAKARERTNSSQKKELERILSGKNLNLGDIESFRRIIVETGSLEYSKEMAKKKIEEGRRAILEADIKDIAKDFLVGVSDYMIKREV